MRRKWTLLLSVAVLLLIGFYIMQRPEPKHFTDFVPSGAEVAKVSTRHSGNGLLYATSDPAVIRHFLLAMQDASFTPARGEAVTGNSGLALLDRDGKPIASFSGNIPGIEEINGDYYRESGVNQKELALFYHAFLTEQHVEK